MELVELKSLWQQANTQFKHIKLVDSKTISKAIHSQSMAPLSKIKRMLQLKLVLGSLAAMVTFILFILSLVQPDKITSWHLSFSAFEYALLFGSLTISIGIMLSFSIQAHMNVTKFQSSSINLKDSLKKVINMMDKIIKFNVFSDTLMTPIIFTWATYAKVVSKVEPSLLTTFIILIVLPLVVGLLSFFIQSYLQKNKFGNYVSQLKANLATLEK